MAPTIRRLGPGDEPMLAHLAGEAPDFDLAGRTSPEPALAPGDAAAYLADPGVLHWVAEEERRVVGELLCHLLRLPSDPGRELLLYSIGVRAAHRRRGIGRALVEEMLRWGARGGRAGDMSRRRQPRGRGVLREPAASSAARTTSRASSCS
jgi:ribosomal protein S18 acetylase RimI-like enzyme